MFELEQGSQCGRNRETEGEDGRQGGPGGDRQIAQGLMDPGKDFGFGLSKVGVMEGSKQKVDLNSSEAHGRPLEALGEQNVGREGRSQEPR